MTKLKESSQKTGKLSTVTKRQEGTTTKQRKVSHKGARQKGLAFEREVAIAMRPLFPDARRWLENHPDDAKGIDLINTGPFMIQCKRYQDYAPINKIFEVECDRVLGDIPVLVTAGNNKPAMAALHFEDFMWLIGEIMKPKDDQLPHAHGTSPFPKLAQKLRSKKDNRPQFFVTIDCIICGLRWFDTKSNVNICPNCSEKG